MRTRTAALASKSEVAESTRAPGSARAVSVCLRFPNSASCTPSAPLASVPTTTPERELSRATGAVRSFNACCQLVAGGSAGGEGEVPAACPLILYDDIGTETGTEAVARWRDSSDAVPSLELSSCTCSPDMPSSCCSMASRWLSSCARLCSSSSSGLSGGFSAT
eukprot:352421-Chlamydomonas_euryale.AAC.1